MALDNSSARDSRQEVLIMLIKTQRQKLSKLPTEAQYLEWDFRLGISEIWIVMAVTLTTNELLWTTRNIPHQNLGATKNLTQTKIIWDAYETNSSLTWWKSQSITKSMNSRLDSSLSSRTFDSTSTSSAPHQNSNEHSTRFYLIESSDHPTGHHSRTYPPFTFNQTEFKKQ